MQVIKNILLTDRHQRPIATDVFLEENQIPKPVIIYAHGFNGFKDWGNFDLIAERFARAGVVFIKFNFAFNGTTPEAPETFADLAAYAENNYTKELDNLATVISWATDKGNPYAAEIRQDQCGLIGHSLGGGIVLLGAAADDRVKAVATWAGIARCQTPWGSWPEAQLQAWQQRGVTYITNSRTKQEMPLNYQLYEDYMQNSDRLDIEAAVKKLHIPLLICHGTEDPAVSVEAAYELHRWQPRSELFTLATDHVFGRRHPWTLPELPDATARVADRTISFFLQAFQ